MLTLFRYICNRTVPSIKKRKKMIKTYRCKKQSFKLIKDAVIYDIVRYDGTNDEEVKELAGDAFGTDYKGRKKIYDIDEAALTEELCSQITYDDGVTVPEYTYHGYVLKPGCYVMKDKNRGGFVGVIYLTEAEFAETYEEVTASNV